MTRSIATRQVMAARRVRHLHSITVRNLTLNPDRDSLFTRPSTFGSRAPDEGDDPTLSLTPKLHTGRPTRTRASSTASWHSATPGERDEREGRELILDVGHRIPRTRPRRSSSAGTLLSRAQKIKEEGEEADGEGDDSSGPTPEAHSPQPAPIPSHSASTSFPFPFPTPSEELSNSTTTTALRARSTSRASVHSNGTTGSNSTIRQAPKLPPSLPSQRPKTRVPSSSQFAAREQKRRVEALRRKLLDSFVSIELAPPPRGPPEKGSDTSLRKGRKRGNTIAAELAAPGSPTGRPGRILQRNASSSSIPSLPHGLSRRRTVSTSLVPTFSEYRTGGTEEEARSPPFFVSTPAKEEVNPCFHIDQSDFIVPSMRAPDVDEEDTSIVFPDEDAIDSWPGLRESRIRVQLFARRTIKERGKDEDRQAAKGKGKVSTASGPRDASEKDEEEAGWKVLTTWDVDLSSLVSLGRNLTAFPSLPPNTLLFTLETPSSPFSFCPPHGLPSIGASTSANSTHELEYFTAPLDVLFAQHRAASSPGLLYRNLRGLRQSLSDDEENINDCSCSSSDEDAGSDGGGGNASDPGIGSSTTRDSFGMKHPAIASSRGRRRTNSLWRERVRVEEDKRKRIELLERSRRETKMVELATSDVVERLWIGERELESARQERRQAEKRLGELVRAGEAAALARDKVEREDRVGDLEGVKEAVADEVDDLERKVQRRREALRMRRDRLERARGLDEANRAVLTALRRTLDESQHTVTTLQTSISARRAHIVTLLSNLFPIEPVMPSPAMPSPPPLLFSISSLALPNSTYPPSYSDDLLSSALGHAALLTLTLAAYLGIPLCYPIIWRGSRSVVKDEISMMKGPRAFPLYGRGVDQYRFDYGVFLLNKNIEQLMYSESLTVLDLRNTLPNLKTLVLSLSFGEWSDEYAKASLRPEGVFAAACAEAEETGPPPEPTGSTGARSEFRSRSSDMDAQEGESSNSSGSTESTSEPSLTPETSVDSLPPRQDSHDPSSASSTRSRSSSLVSAASTVRPSRIESPVPSEASSSSPPDTAGRRKSKSGQVRSSDGEEGTEKGSDAEARIPSVSNQHATKGQVEEGKRKRKESYGTKFASSVWSAVAGKAADRSQGNRHSGPGAMSPTPNRSREEGETADDG